MKDECRNDFPREEAEECGKKRHFYSDDEEAELRRLTDARKGPLTLNACEEIAAQLGTNRSGKAVRKHWQITMMKEQAEAQPSMNAPCPEEADYTPPVNEPEHDVSTVDVDVYVPRASVHDAFADWLPEPFPWMEPSICLWISFLDGWPQQCTCPPMLD